MTSGPDALSMLGRLTLAVVLRACLILGPVRAGCLARHRRQRLFRLLHQSLDDFDKVVDQALDCKVTFGSKFSSIWLVRPD